MKDEIAKARRKLSAASTVMVTTHQRPDGDAISSMLALHLGLVHKGIRSKPILFDQVPHRFRFLPGASEISATMESIPDLLVVVDCADYDRIGFSDDKDPLPVDLNIDHHPTNTKFAEINLVEPRAASATELLYNLIPELGLDLIDPVRENLLTGLITDTIGFRTENVTPRTLRIAADLLEAGSHLDELYHLAVTRKEFLAVKYWAGGLARLAMEDGLFWTYLTESDRLSTGYSGNDDADLIDLMTSIEGIKIAIVFIEQDSEHVKVSFRSRGGVDVSKLAAQFGGGGHKPASGAMIEGNLQDVMDRVVDAARRTLATKQIA